MIQVYKQLPKQRTSLEQYEQAWPVDVPTVDTGVELVLLNIEEVLDATN